MTNRLATRVVWRPSKRNTNGVLRSEEWTKKQAEQDAKLGSQNIKIAK